MNDSKQPKERKLSKAELKRKAEFDALADRLAAEGYTQKLLSLSESEIKTKMFLVTLPAILLYCVLFLCCGNRLDFTALDFFLSVALFFVLIIVHEALHGFTWACFAKDKWKSISFGIIPESCMAYCNCKEPLKKYQIVLGTLMPTIVLGFGLGIAAIISGSVVLLFTAVFNTMGCGGDLLIVFKVLTYKSDAENVLMIDHPYEIGTAVFEK